MEGLASPKNRQKLKVKNTYNSIDIEGITPSPKRANTHRTI
jgi:hypothetical protein